jgi:hypothetical protein
MTWAEYIINYLIPSWFQTFRGNFRIWKDLMTGNYKDYALMWYDDPYEECYEWFWGSIGDDDTLSKDFLDHIRKLAKQVESGEVKTYTLYKFKKDLREEDETLQ